MSSTLNESGSSFNDLVKKQTELLEKRKELMHELGKIEDDAFKAGVKFNKPKRTNSRPAIDGSDSGHVQEADFQNRKKIRTNEGTTGSGVNKKLYTSSSYEESKKKLSSAIIRPGEKKHEEEFKVEHPKPLEMPKDLQNRNKKLFGNLMGHLNKAKKILESQEDRLKKQGEVLQKAEERNHEESSKLKEEHMKVLEKKREEMLREKINLEKEIFKLDQDRLVKLTEKHYTDISNGNILTETTPKIMWRPAKFNSSLEKLQTNSSDVLNKMKENAVVVVGKIIKDLQEKMEAAEYDDNKEEERAHDDTKEKKSPEKEEDSGIRKRRRDHESDDSDIEKPEND